MSQPVLIIEDEPEIASLIEFHVAREGHRTRIVSRGRDALAAAKQDKPRLIILDIMLPDLDGLEICRRLKHDESTRQIPVVFVSAKGEEADVVTGLELGADDYITKPFSPRVLVARIRTVLRRVEGAADSSQMITLVDGRLAIDQARHEVRIDGELVKLTLTQHRILEYLAKKPGFVRTRQQIVNAVHGDDAVLSSRAVDVHIVSLRQQMGDLGKLVKTVRGVGYRILEGSEDF